MKRQQKRDSARVLDETGSLNQLEQEELIQSFRAQDFRLTVLTKGALTLITLVAIYYGTIQQQIFMTLSMIGLFYPVAAWTSLGILLFSWEIPFLVLLGINLHTALEQNSINDLNEKKFKLKAV